MKSESAEATPPPPLRRYSTQCPVCGGINTKWTDKPCKHCGGGGSIVTYSASEVDARLAQQAETIEKLEKELLYWKVCSNCGEVMTAPGACDNAISEHEKGLEQMVEDLMERAEQAESKLAEVDAALRARDSQLKSAASDLTSAALTQGTEERSNG